MSGVSHKFLLIFGFIFLIFSTLFPFASKAAGASLYLAPDAGTFFVGNTFDVSIFVNTGGENINAVEVNLKFDPAKLQVASPTAGKSFIQVWVAQPTFSNTQGTMSFIGGIPTPGINTSSGLVSTVTLRAIAPGETSIVITEASKVLRNDPNGTNILTSRGRGVYKLMIPPPEGPQIFSLTHPDQNKWYKNNNLTFAWEKEENVTDFSYSFDQSPTNIPDNVSEGDFNSVSYTNTADGIWYFHVKAEKVNVWGGTSHYVVNIDSSPPAAFTPTVEPSANTSERQPIVSFFTTDAFSGLDHYEIKYINISQGKKEETVGFFIEATTPYRLPSLEIGKYLVVVRAYDVAGNFREGNVNIQIFPRGLVISKKGIQFHQFIIPWWLLVLFLVIIILLILIYLLKKHRDFKREKERHDEFERRLRERQIEIAEKMKAQGKDKTSNQITPSGEIFYGEKTDNDNPYHI